MKIEYENNLLKLKSFFQYKCVDLDYTKIALIARLFSKVYTIEDVDINVIQSIINSKRLFKT